MNSLRNRFFIAALATAVILSSSLLHADTTSFFKGYSYMQGGEYSKAIEKFRKAIEEDSAHSPSYSNLALCYERKENYDEAIFIWERYMGLAPAYQEKVNDHIILIEEMKKVKAYLASGKTAESIPLLEKISHDSYPGSIIRLQALKEISHHYFTTKEYKKSLSSYQTIMANYPEEMTSNMSLEYAQSLLHERQFSRALEVYERLAASSLHSDLKDDVQYGFGRAYLGLKKYNKAVEYLEKLIREYPHSPLLDQALYQLGMSCQESGDWERGATNFERLCREHPQSSYLAQAIYQAGYCYQMLKEDKKAINLYEQVIDKYSDSLVADDAHYQIGTIYYSEKRYEEAVERFNVILKRYPRSNKLPDTLYYLAEYQFNQISSEKNIDKGGPLPYKPVIDITTKIINNYPGTKRASEAQYLIMKCYHQQGDYLKRDKAFLNYANIGARYYDPEKVAKIAKQMGDGYFKVRRYDNAKDFYKLITDRFPESKVADETRFMLGKCFEGMDRYKQSLAHYQALIDKCEEGAQAPIWEAIADNFAKQEKHHLAIENYERAGKIYRKQEHYDKAIKAYEKIIKCYPEGEHVLKAWLLTALNYLDRGQEAEALGRFQKLGAAYPGHELGIKAKLLIAYHYMSNADYHRARAAYQKILASLPAESPYLKETERLLGRLTKLTSNNPGKVTPDTGNTGPNVLLISIDTLRADHLGCYGCSEDTSPNIDQLAEESTLFSNAISACSWTTPSHMSIFTSLYPFVHQVVSTQTKVDEARVTLAETLKEEGYTTAAFISAPTMLPYEIGYGQGFDIYDDYSLTFDLRFDLFGLNEELKGQNERRISPFTDRLVTHWLRRNHNKKFFLFAHYWDIHGDYSPPPPYDTMFDPDYRGEFSGANEYINQIKPGMEKRDLEHMVALYDGEIRYVDEYIGKLLRTLEELNVLDNTIIILTADHGEEFLEHGDNWHGRTLYDEVIHVPLIIRYPSLIPQGKTITNLASTINIMPTVLDILGIPLKERVQGRSLLPLIAGRERGEEEPYYSETESRQDLKSIRTDNFKFVYHVKDGEVELYDLRGDPQELINLAEVKPELTKQWQRRLFAWMNESTKLLASLSKTAPKQEIPMDEEKRKRLKALGYLH